MAKEGKEKKKGSCLKTILIIVAVIIIIGIIGAALGGSDSEDSSPDTTTTTSTDAAEDTESTDEGEQTPEAEEESNIFYPGDVLETDDLKLSYLSCGEYSDDNILIEPGEGNKFVSFEFEFENTGNTDLSVGSFGFNCYADGYEASQALVTSDNSLTSIATLSPGRKASGIVVFEVPTDATEIEVEYETNFWTQDKAIFVYQ